MRIRKTFFDIYKLLIISLMFDAYALFYIQTFPVTPFTVFSILFVGLCIIRSRENILKINRRSILLVLLLISIVFNFVFYECKNSTSFMQSVYFIVLCILAYREETRERFDGYCEFFQRFMTIMSIYGIYQFLGRMLELPFTDLIIPDHMIKGYNWTNIIYVFGLSLYRSNAVFREPSFFGQMIAISLLLYVPEFLNKEKQVKNYLVPIMLQIVALILTFSGTGLFMIGMTLILYLLLSFKTRKIWKRILLFVILGILVVLYILLFTSLGSYLLLRLNELFVYNRDASSGFVRFRSWVYVVEDAWNRNFLFGSGIGMGSEYIAKYASQFYGMTLNGFAKVATELGVCGLFLWMSYLLISLKKGGTSSVDNKILMLSCSMLLLVFMHEAFSSNIFWGFLMLMNCKLVNNRVE